MGSIHWHVVKYPVSRCMHLVEEPSMLLLQPTSHQRLTKTLLWSWTERQIPRHGLGGPRVVSLLRSLQAYLFRNVRVKARRGKYKQAALTSKPRMAVAETEKGKLCFPYHAYAFTGGDVWNTPNYVSRGLYRNRPRKRASVSQWKCAFPHVGLQQSEPGGDIGHGDGWISHFFSSVNTKSLHVTD